MQRIGTGYDIHRLEAGRRFVLGGVELPADRGPLGHSDGDALLHAAIDALLGAAALGDIGGHFPPSDPAWRDADSRDLAARVVAELRAAGWTIVNLDVTVLLEAPRLAPHIASMRAAVAQAFGIAPERVSIKAKTNEGLDAVGEGRAVAAQSVVLIERPDTYPLPPSQQSGLRSVPSREGERPRRVAAQDGLVATPADAPSGTFPFPEREGDRG